MSSCGVAWKFCSGSAQFALCCLWVARVAVSLRVASLPGENHGQGQTVGDRCNPSLCKTGAGTSGVPAASFARRGLTARVRLKRTEGRVSRRIIRAYTGTPLSLSLSLSALSLPSLCLSLSLSPSRSLSVSVSVSMSVSMSVSVCLCLLCFCLGLLCLCLRCLCLSLSLFSRLPDDYVATS